MIREYVKNGLIGMAALVCVASRFVPGAQPAPLLSPPVLMAAERPSVTTDKPSDNVLAIRIDSALRALTSAVRPLSHPKALETAFRSYFAYVNAHPSDVKKPLLYFVDYGLPSTEPRGYVFNMNTMSILEGPFTVAHGRGSSVSRYGVPTRFSNGFGSAMTSLGLYVAQELYRFTGHAGGMTYSSVGLRLQGVTRGSNDNARARGVVAHGAPYVSATKAGRSEGCPAMEEQRAERVLPELANGGMVFLFAPESQLLASTE
ncbi:MAG TPA: murein L,D-transpeptidase catalytic domain family protein [Gemmatimonadaceae bacterium]